MLITYITIGTIGTAIFLLCWYFFSPEAKDLVESDWKEYERTLSKPDKDKEKNKK